MKYEHTYYDDHFELIEDSRFGPKSVETDNNIPIEQATHLACISRMITQHLDNLITWTRISERDYPPMPCHWYL